MSNLKESFSKEFKPTPEQLAKAEAFIEENSKKYKGLEKLSCKSHVNDGVEFLKLGTGDLKRLNP